MLSQTYLVSNISCSHCTHTIERELKLVQGVQSVKADEQSKHVTVGVDTPEKLQAVEAMLVEIGYPGSRT
jgi:copper chaperone CopZ